MNSTSKFILGLSLFFVSACASAPKEDAPPIPEPDKTVLKEDIPPPKPPPKKKKPVAKKPRPAKKPITTKPVKPRTKVVKKPGKPQKIPKLLQEVEAKYKKAATLSANFFQTKEVASMGMKKDSRGKIFLKRPDKIRWETNYPDSSLLISDGKSFWFYTPPFDEDEKGQVIIRKSSQVKTRLANALLQGSFSVAKGMKIKTRSRGNYTLIPVRRGMGNIKEARLHVNTRTKHIDQVILIHRGGNRTEINLKNIVLGKKLANSKFRFKIPKNTEIMKE